MAGWFWSAGLGRTHGLASHWPPSPSIVITEIEGDSAAYDPKNERVVVLNETASVIWRLSDGDRTLDELVELLAGQYRLDPDAIRDEVVAVVAAEGFLARDPSAEPHPSRPADEFGS